MVLFGQCGADRVDIDKWTNQRALLKCFTCGRTAWVEGFTGSKLDFVDQLFGDSRPVRQVPQAQPGRSRAALS